MKFNIENLYKHAHQLIDPTAILSWGAPIFTFKSEHKRTRFGNFKKWLERYDPSLNEKLHGFKLK